MHEEAKPVWQRPMIQVCHIMHYPTATHFTWKERISMCHSLPSLDTDTISNMHNKNFCTVRTTQLTSPTCSCALPSPPRHPGSPALSPLVIPKPHFRINPSPPSFSPPQRKAGFSLTLVLPKVSQRQTVEAWGQNLETDPGGSLGKQCGQQRTVPVSL